MGSYYTSSAHVDLYHGTCVQPEVRGASVLPKNLSLALSKFTFGVPSKLQWHFADPNVEKEAAVLFSEAIRILCGLGGTLVHIDYQPFKEAADLLYEGPWVGERLAALEGMARKKRKISDNEAISVDDTFSDMDLTEV